MKAVNEDNGGRERHVRAGAGERGPRSEVAVIVVNHNGPHRTRETIASLLRQTLPPRRVMVVDNGSTDDSAALLAEWFAGSLEIERSETNLGFSGGVNAGLRRLLSSGPPVDYVLLVNNDAVLADDAVQQITTYMTSHPDLGVVGGRVLDAASGRLQEAGGGSVSWITGATETVSYHRLDYVTGAFACLRRELLEDGCRMPQEYFLYWEDVAFSLRVKARGWRVGYCPEAVAWHERNATLGSRSVLGDELFVVSGVRFFLREDGFRPVPALLLMLRRVAKRLVLGPVANVPAIGIAFVRGVREATSAPPHGARRKGRREFAR